MANLACHAGVANIGGGPCCTGALGRVQKVHSLAFRLAKSQPLLMHLFAEMLSVKQTNPWQILLVTPELPT